MTVEAAVSISVLVVVLVACLTGISCVVAQLRCTDAAREVARLSARGDRAGADQSAEVLAPQGYSVGIETRGDMMVVTVSAPAVGGLLPGVQISAIGVSVVEDTGQSG